MDYTRKLRNRGRAIDEFLNHLKKDKFLLILIAPTVAYFIIFHYLPMYGIIIAFKNFNMGKGILLSPWAGFKWFEQFFKSIYFFRLVRNTFLLSLYSLIFSFPVTILFTLMLNEVKNNFSRRIVQSVSSFPHFISTVVVVGIAVNLLSINNGLVNNILNDLGLAPIEFFSDKKWFRTIYVGLGIWQNFGWNSIIYLGAVSTIDPQLYEAARIDGAGRLKQIWYVTLPGIMPVAITMLILAMGKLLNVGFEKIILLYNPSIYEVADVISTYVYRRGIVNAEYSFGTAVGLFNSVVNLIFLYTANKLSKWFNGAYLW